MYEITLDHPGLNKHRVIRGQEPEVVQRRADYIKAIWDEQWESRLPAESLRRERKAARQKREDAKAAEQERKKKAEERRKEAQERIEPPRQALPDTLSENDAVDQAPLRDKPSFLKKEPVRRSKPEPAVKFRVLDYLLPFIKRRRIKADGNPNHAVGLG
jgi:restriction system protein